MTARKHARAAGPRDSLDAYLRSISSHPLLPHSEIIALARHARCEERSFAESMAAMRETSLALLEHWQGRRASGRVTGLMGRGYREADDRDWTAHIDACMQRLARLVKRKPNASTRRSMAACVLEAEIALELLIEIHGRLAAQPAPRGSARALREASRALAARGAALGRIVDHNVRLVVGIVKRYRNMGVPLLDLIQEGNLGLMRAAEKFDPERGYRFSTYGVWWIEQAAVRAIQNHSRTVRAPSNLYDGQLRQRRAAHEFRILNGRDPLPEELADSLGMSAKEVEAVLAMGRPIASLQESAADDASLSLEERLRDEAAEDPVETIDRAELREEIGRLLHLLDPRERRVVEWRFGLRHDPPATLAEIGERLGLSRERVRQINAGALARLREVGGVEALAASIGD